MDIEVPLTAKNYYYYYYYMIPSLALSACCGTDLLIWFVPHWKKWLHILIFLISSAWSLLVSPRQVFFFALPCTKRNKNFNVKMEKTKQKEKRNLTLSCPWVPIGTYLYRFYSVWRQTILFVNGEPLGQERVTSNRHFSVENMHGKKKLQQLKYKVAAVRALLLYQPNHSISLQT